MPSSKHNHSRSKAHVIIVGGGTIGLSTAYFLLSEQKVQCSIVESDSPVSQASGWAAGELSPLSIPDAPQPFIDLSIEGLRLHRQFASKIIAESGIDYNLEDIPFLRLALTPKEELSVKRNIAWYNQLGFPSWWMDTQQIAALNPWLSTNVRGASYTMETQLETYDFGLALARAGMYHGLKIRHATVTGLSKSGDKITGVEIGDDVLTGDHVVIATGPWAQYIEPWIGYPIPIKPIKGQLLYLDTPESLPKQGVYHGTNLILPKRGSRLILGSTYDDSGFDREPSISIQNQILNGVRKFTPGLTDLQVNDSSACLRPVSPDEMPLLGPAPGWEGLHLATGHGRKGILQSLATGKYLAQLIIKGESKYPLGPFSPERLSRFKI